MKRFTITALAAGLMAATGAAWADAECQAGSSYGAKPGCGHPDSVPYIAGNNSGGPASVHGNGWGWGVPGAIFGSALGLPHMGNRTWVDPNTGLTYSYPNNSYPQHSRNLRDRDGDGVADIHDRYPRDRRYY